MTEKKQTMRWRCTTVGCNPTLDEITAEDHKDATLHNVAKWPVRSNSGKKKAAARNKGGYYDKYNVGAKSYEARVESGHIVERGSF